VFVTAQEQVPVLLPQHQTDPTLAFEAIAAYAPVQAEISAFPGKPLLLRPFASRGEWKLLLRAAVRTNSYAPVPDRRRCRLLAADWQLPISGWCPAIGQLAIGNRRLAMRTFTV
jgi:hypothetical protein